MMRRRIGVVLQDKRLLEHLTAFDNVALTVPATSGIAIGLPMTFASVPDATR